ncbi:MAG: response regulator [Chloroflexi bacterium]|nr:response regulator [Chloroflexota bacterium]
MHSGISYATIEAVDGKQAVELTRSAKPDLLLMDIQMSGMDGLEAARIIKADSTTNKIPIIALTALAMAEDKERIIHSGFNNYMSKPINLGELLEMVKDYLS